MKKSGSNGKKFEKKNAKENGKEKTKREIKKRNDEKRHVMTQDLKNRLVDMKMEIEAQAEAQEMIEAQAKLETTDLPHPEETIETDPAQGTVFTSFFCI